MMTLNGINQGNLTSSVSEHCLGADLRCEHFEALPKKSCERRNNAARNTVAAMLLVALLLPLVSADIIIDKPVAQVGDLVRIRVVPALQDQVFIIITPNETYRFIGGMPENAAFVPTAPGVHNIRIIDNNALVDSASFTVLGNGEAAPAQRRFGVSAGEIVIGEPLLIDAPLDAIVGIGEEYLYDHPARPITFITKESGMLDVWARHANGTVEHAQVVVKGTDPLLVAVAPATATPIALWQDGEGSRQTAIDQVVESGAYDVELRDISPTLKSVRFRQLQYSGKEFKVKAVAPGQIKGNIPPGVVDAFAIDPAALDFSDASMTFTAVGIALYKCKAYDYATQTCFGENRKIMDLVPGEEYTLALTPEDPLFSQTGYLTNQNFDTSTAGWTTLSEGPNPVTFAYTSSDTPQSGVAEMTISGPNRNGFGNYYQTFNLTIPAGTVLAGINFSALWRVSSYHSQAGTIYLWVQDATQTSTWCQANTSFSAVTSWSFINASAPSNCPVGNFTPNTNYTFRLRCQLNTGGGGGSVETCRWDNASITVWYNDTTAPTMRDATETPDPVNFSNAINITVNITDNIAVSTALVEIAGVNYTLIDGPGDIYYYDGFNTSRMPGVYQYTIFFNDTNNNRVTNTSLALNFTIVDVYSPNITPISPSEGNFTSLSTFTASYNVTDQVNISNCSLNVSGTVTNSTLSPVMATTLFLSSPLAEGQQYWNITCNDTSNNRNTSITRTITRDSAAPVVYLNISNGTVTNNSTIPFTYTLADANPKNCSLWTNATGTWQVNASNASVAAGVGVFNVSMAQGVYLWNVQCFDLAANTAFNSTNYTLHVDRTAPKYSGISVSPASGGTYSQGAAYQFNITWQDNESAITVRFESNVSGTLANTTPTKNGDVYTTSIAALGGGDYAYRWYAQDSGGNTNQTTQQTYVVVKAQPVLNLTLNGSSANMSVPLLSHINSTGTVLSPASGYIELYVDGARANSGLSRLENTTQLSEERRYNFTLIFNATQNHSSARLSLFADVIDTTPPSVELGNPANNSIQPSTVLFFFTPRDNVEIANCTIVLDDVMNATKDVSRNTLENITVSGIPDGTHNWTVNCTDTSNNSAMNQSRKYVTVDTQPPAEFSLSSPASGTISSNLSPTLAWGQTADPTFARYSLEADNDAGFGSINHQANTSPVSNTTHSFALADQTVWHWRVTAYDLAGNNRTAAAFNYTADATAPVVTLTTPANASHTNRSSIQLNFTVVDFTPVVNCSLYVNGSLNQTNASVTQQANSFTVPVAEGDYLWSVRCFDSALNQGSSQQRTLVVDRTAPAAFSITGPADNTTTSDNTPTYFWTQSADPYFRNYTIEVSDNESFPYANHTLATTAISNTSIEQSPALGDGIWYWRVTAYDLAGNNRTVHPTIIVDTTPPAAFGLVAPANNTEVRNTTPVLEWEQSNDPNFANYTVLLTDSPDFSYANATYNVTPKTNTSLQVTVQQNITYYWKVIAYDYAGNSRNSTNTFLYLADFANPIVTQISPLNNTAATTSSLVQFRFNVTDPGTLANCSLYINNTFDKILNSPQKNVPESLSSNLENGNYSWYVSCTDISGNTGNSSTYFLNVNVQLPAQRLYESAVGATTPAAPALINLSYVNDSTESSVTVSLGNGGLSNLVNGSYVTDGQGMLIYNSTVVNFSGVFSATRANEFVITWKLYKGNASGLTLLCQHGNDGATGTSITNTAKQTYAGACNTTSDTRLFAGDNLTLVVNTFKNGGTTRSITHYWEGVSFDSNVRFLGYKLGTLTVNFTNFTDPAPSEDATYVEQCNVTCSAGYCLNAEVFLQQWNGSAWQNVSSSGNITLNGSQSYVESYGNLNTTNITNFTLYGATHSANNSLRCYAYSLYSENVSSVKNVSVIDRTAPDITMHSPEGNAVFDRANVSFLYTPYDRRLSSCSLWGNFSGTWMANETDPAPLNGSQNSFGPIYLDYGIYVWNVFCNDTVGNEGGAGANRTLYIAGDVEITAAKIAFSDESPAEGQEIAITANITNNANITYENVAVRFWQGDPAVDGVQIGSDRLINLSPYGSNTTSENWTAIVGTHQIYVEADALGNIIEHDETNNIDNKTIYISMWQQYYGNVTANLTLGSAENASFLNWQLTDRSGNIFIADSDTTNSIGFAFLQPLGRNASGEVNANTADDFAELDTIINTTGFNDSVNLSYTLSGSPNAEGSFLLFGRTVQQVPVDNTSANFTTGILWDADDSLNSYYDSTDIEDVIFVTRIKNATLGAAGIADYEIQTPSRLKNYKGGTATVSFYYELQ